MLRLSKSSIFLLAAAGIYAAPAHGQATRTWVSGVGDDLNPCSRTAPCKTFAGAISKTAAGGEINCLDPGGFGAVTITKSITIDCTGTTGSILASSTFGVTLNGAGIDVVLRGLSINGGTPALPGVLGVRFLQGNSLSILDTHIFNFRAAGAASGFGVSITPSTSARVFIHNTTITNNGTASTGGGILIKPTGTGTAHVSLEDVQIVNNAGSGFRVDTQSNAGAGIIFSMEHVRISGGGKGIDVNAVAGFTGVVGLVDFATINNNSGNGIGITGTGAVVIRVGNSTITDNAGGVIPGTGQINSFGNNRLIGNPTGGASNNGAFTGAVIPPT